MKTIVGGIIERRVCQSFWDILRYLLNTCEVYGGSGLRNPQLRGDARQIVAVRNPNATPELCRGIVAGERMCVQQS